MPEPADPDARLQELLDRYLSAVQMGRPVDRAAWLAAHPELREWAGVLDAIDRLAPTGPPVPVADATAAADPPPPPNATLPFRPGPAEASPANGVRLFGRYEILGELGRGGMGVVYKARQPDLDRVVALKMVLAGAHASEGQLLRFQGEARTVARLRHPSVVQVFEAGQCDGIPYLAMEFVDGPSLAQLLRSGRPDLPTSLGWLAAIARAVQHLHDENIVHRDIKPANILMRRGRSRGQGSGVRGQRREDQGKREEGKPGEAHRNARQAGDPLFPSSLTPDPDPLTPAFPPAPTPALADFGLARMLESESGLTGSGAVLGTPSYMAPEQAAGRVREVGPAADIYALGAILYELLTGRPPFEGETAVETLVQVLDREPTPPRHLDPKIPVVLERLCLRCLDKDAARRPGRAADLAEALERYVSGEEVLLPAGGPVRAIRRWARREPALASRTLAFAVGTLALVGKYVLTDAFVDPRHHLVRSLVTQAALMAWIGVSWVFQRLLDRPGWADRVPTLWTLADVVAATVCLCALDGLFSPLTIAFPLLVGTSGLWFRVGQVWFTTVCSLVGFAALVCWTGGPAFEAPNLFRHAFYAGGLGVQGLATALLVQRVHVMARYAGRRAE